MALCRWHPAAPLARSLYPLDGLVRISLSPATIVKVNFVPTFG